MTFFEKLIKNCSSWEELVSQNKFIIKLLNQEIDNEQFYNFWIQSCLYMRIYKKCFKILKMKDESFENQEFCNYFLSKMKSNNFIDNSYGYPVPKKEEIIMNSVSMKYVNFLLTIAIEYSYNDLLMALAPCIIAYGYFFHIFNDFRNKHNSEITFTDYNKVLSIWVKGRDRSQLSRSTLKYINFINDFAKKNKIDFDDLSDIFNNSVEHEIDFFYIISNDKLMNED